MKAICLMGGTDRGLQALVDGVVVALEGRVARAVVQRVQPPRASTPPHPSHHHGHTAHQPASAHAPHGHPTSHPPTNESPLPNHWLLLSPSVCLSVRVLLLSYLLRCPYRGFCRTLSPLKYSTDATMRST